VRSRRVKAQTMFQLGEFYLKRERLQQAEAGDPRAAAALGTYRQTLGI